MKIGRKGKKAANRTGFSLIELVIVVVIIAIIGAIAIPKMSRASTGASESALVDDLNVLRNAVDLYNVEHPSKQLTSTNFTLTSTDPTTVCITNLLTEYSDVLGSEVSTTQGGSDGKAIYGPYIRGGAFPALPLGTAKGGTGVSGTQAATDPTSNSIGWYFDGTTFWAYCASDEVDSNNKPYNTY